MIEYNLQNGINVYYYPIKNAYSVALGLYINLGVKDESSENNGITHLLEHLHFRKLGDWEQKDIYYNMNKIGAALNGSTYKELLKFSIKARPKYFFECLEFFLRILITYNWTEEDLINEKKIVMNELHEKEAYMDISTYVDELAWKNSPLSLPIIGTEHSIENITLEQIVKYKKQYFRAGNLTLIITGNAAENDVQEAVNKIEKIQLNNYPLEFTKKCSLPVNIFNRALNIEFIDCDWNYVDVNISFDIDNINSEVAALLNSIIGGGIGSILPNIIREQYGLVYDIFSKIDIYNEKSIMNIEFSTKKQNICICLKEIINILNLVKKNISTEDIDANIIYFTENSWYLLENPEVLNEELGWKSFAADKLSFSIEEKIEKYKKINQQTLMDFAKKTFVSKNASLIILGQTSHITKQEIKLIISELDI